MCFFDRGLFCVPFFPFHFPLVALLLYLSFLSYYISRVPPECCRMYQKKALVLGSTYRLIPTPRNFLSLPESRYPTLPTLQLFLHPLFTPGRYGYPPVYVRSFLCIPPGLFFSFSKRSGTLLSFSGQIRTFPLLNHTPRGVFFFFFFFFCFSFVFFPPLFLFLFFFFPRILPKHSL